MSRENRSFPLENIRRLYLDFFAEFDASVLHFGGGDIRV
jgi:hypothetical protein